MDSMDLLDDRVTVNQVAKHLGVHVATVYRWTCPGVRGKRLRSFLVGGRRYVAVSDLDSFLCPVEKSISENDSKQLERAQERRGSRGIASPKGKGGAI